MRVHRILHRYVFREVVVHTLLSLAVCAVLFVVQNTLRRLEDVLAAGIGLGGLLQLTAIILPTYVSDALPMSLVFGVLLAFGRMVADGEMLALRASGVSHLRLLSAVVLLGLLGVGMTAYVLFEVEPNSHYKLRLFLREVGKSVNAIRPGSFVALGDRVVYVHAVGARECPLRGPVIADLSDPDRHAYIFASCGEISDVDEDRIALSLREGSIHFSESRLGHYRTIRFASMRVHVDLSEYLSLDRSVDDHTFSALLELRRRHGRGEDISPWGLEPSRLIREIHRRLAFSVAPAVLVLLALPLGARPLRPGRSAGALLAVAVAASYYVLLRFGDRAAALGWVPAWLGLWLPNAVVAALAIHLIRRLPHREG